METTVSVPGRRIRCVLKIHIHLPVQKKAFKNLERMYPDANFYSIEKLTSYYYNFDSETQDTEDYREAIYADIELAMVRLDELCDGNDFHRGDQMRINEVRKVLKCIKEKLLGQ